MKNYYANSRQLAKNLYFCISEYKSNAVHPLIVAFVDAALKCKQE